MYSLRPAHYNILIEPDLTAFTFQGTVEITFEPSQTSADIILNALELEIEACELIDQAQTLPCRFALEPEQEILRISLPASTSSPIHIRVRYRGQINDKMAGFYRSAYRIGESEHWIAVTQFQESDARRAFPCADHPLYKATFDVALTIDANLSAISNGDSETTERLADGRQRIKFQTTPPMSTYLLFWAVGEFDFVRDSVDPRVRVAYLPGMKPYTSFGLTFGRQALRYCEQYYGIPYPLAKMDLIAIPDFAFGAMENWGAITFRENLLLYDPALTSSSGQERICEVTAHEIAHQWFGNLVTPADWKYLWLNESFATYFGFGIVNHHYPDWGVWEQFLHGQTDTAMARDALHETFPIEIPGGEHVVINAATAPLIYNKGGSILRQVEGYIGADRFQQGLRHYLKTHAYDCAASHHLWEAFEAVAQKPVNRMVQRWIEQPGFPLIEVWRDGAELCFRQQKFTYLPQDAPEDPAAVWPVPINVEVYTPDRPVATQQFLLEEPEGRISIAKDTQAFKVNTGQTGFYRVRYTQADDLQALGHLIRDRQLPPIDRWGVQSDLYALLQRGTVTLDAYLAFLDHYTDEDAFLPLISIDRNLFHAYLLLGASEGAAVMRCARDFHQKTLQRIGYRPEEGEPHTTAILRDQMLWHAAVCGDEDVQATLQRLFTQLTQGEAVHPDIMRSVMQAGALKGDKATFEWMVARMAETASEHERLNILTAWGAFSDPALLTEVRQYVLQHVPPRNQFIPLVAMAQNPHALSELWPWYLSHIDQLEQFHAILYERVIAAFVPVAGLFEADRVETFMTQYATDQPQFKDVINLSLEKMAIYLRMRTAAKTV